MTPITDMELRLLMLGLFAGFLVGLLVGLIFVFYI